MKKTIDLSVIFTELFSKYGTPHTKTEALRKVLFTAYSEPKRYYHNLQHLREMFGFLEEVRPLVTNYDAFTFAIFYHDAVYLSSSKSNEYESALLAGKVLTSADVSPEIINLCCEHILATQFHQKQNNNDTNLFLDCDLAILAAEPERYKAYTQQIRNEYIDFDNSAYQVGRTKVLNHFLNLPTIYKSNWFIEKYENKARQNIRHELSLLSR